MKTKKVMTWAVAIATVTVGVSSCGLDIPKEVPSSYETMTVKKSDIELTIKFSAIRRYNHATGKWSADED